MKYAILSDIHGNLTALNTVLEDLEEEGIDEFVCLGDLVGYGPDPIGVVQRMRDLCSIVVAGNHDYGISGVLSLSYFNRYARDAAIWAREQLTDNQLSYLSNLPLLDRNEEALFVHATVESPELFEYVLTAYDAHVNMRTQDRPISFHGHSHVPVNFLLDDAGAVSHNQEQVVSLEKPQKAMVNVGSVGQPRDGDERASYGVYDTEEERIEIHRVQYDIDRTAEKIREAGLPEILGERLYHGK